METVAAKVVGPRDGEAGFLGSIGVRFAEPQTLANLCARYELEMNSDSVPGLIQRFDLRFPGEPI
jgi:hypothetical protein